MYINGRTVAVQGRVAIYKWPPRPLLVRPPWECAAPRSGARCVHTVEHKLSYGTSVRGPDYVITEWPISDHMQSSKKDVTEITCLVPCDRL
ncbi:unnamed protein product [Staurois parvus]|uniref:Uncharacterized protein n=1 Tax=Staurois parvus TaxID=386267 RepID=A0ABN9DYE9_9NEOB|nr:unnamed protein product [Staurois parvus]